MEDQKKKILLINLGVLTLYTLFSFIVGRREGAIYDAFFIVAHVLISGAIGIGLLIFSKNKPHIGGAFLLSAGLVLLIGFGTCFGIANMFNY